MSASSVSEAEKAFEEAVSRSQAANQAGYDAARAALAAHYDDTLDAASKAALAAASKAAVVACDVADAQVVAIDRIKEFESAAKAFATAVTVVKASRKEKMEAAYAAMSNAVRDPVSFAVMLKVTRDPVIYATMVNAGMRQGGGLLPTLKADVPSTVSPYGGTTTVSTVTVI
jgi:hypothetical protein